jgi:threonine/homoserine efflux transporter RhtA
MAGWLVLSEQLSAQQLLAMGLIMAASMDCAYNAKLRGH